MDISSVDVWIIVDECGEFAIGSEESEAAEAYENNIGSLSERSTRRLKVTVNVPYPAATNITVTVPIDNPDPVSVKVE